jgi:hypothetical protein
MAVVAPFILLETAGTKLVMALAAWVQAIRAIIVIAACTDEAAFGAIGVTTTAAARFTATTNALVASLAGEAVIFIHDSATIDTRTTEPDFQRHEGTVGVVGPESIGHEGEKVE